MGVTAYDVTITVNELANISIYEVISTDILQKIRAENVSIMRFQ